MLVSRRWGWTGLVVAAAERGSRGAASTGGLRRSMAGGRMWGGIERARVLGGLGRGGGGGLWEWC